ncbi:thioredoxin family protein [Candidatus Uhrbacteria bacterium]|nr:thioredoxin family protein [Candidatus Uhrbacteria bacterium]
MSVIIYSTPTCPYCKQAKQYFKEHNVQYEEKDVSADSAAQAEMTKKSGGFMGVPVIDINGTIITGFDKPKIEAALKS